MRALRRAHPIEGLAVRSASIVERLSVLDAYVQARRIALYWPLIEQHEVDLRKLDAAARAAGKGVYYPFMDDPAGAKPGVFNTGFRPVDAPQELKNRGHGFSEPLPEKVPAVRGDIDLIVVPAVAVSQSGHRLGMGIGFYDATLPDFCPPAVSVAVAYDFQFLAEIPTETRDVACQMVVTERRIIPARAG